MNENFYGITDIGRLRDNNEDAFLAKRVGDNYIIGASIDGVGGYSGGEIASAFAKEAFLNIQQFTDVNIPDVLVNAIESANKKIFEEKLKTKEYNQMACVLTVAVADINNNKFYYAHIGDTRLYLYRDGGLVKVTRDHSAVGFLEETGRLSEAEAMSHPKRNEINKALGFEVEQSAVAESVDTAESPFLPGDILLLCTDGLSDMLTSVTITEVLNKESSLKEKAHTLINEANAAGGRDNITVVLIQNDKAPVEHIAIKPEKQKEGPPKKIESHPPRKITGIIEENSKSKKSEKFPKTIWIAGLIFLAVLLFFLRPSHRNPVIPPARIATAKDTLQDSISKGAGNTITIDYKIKNIPIADSLVITKDSLHIIGNGSILFATPSYHGPGIIVRPGCNYLLLDSVTLKGFDIGILVKQKGLHLKNVKFEDCKLPIQYQFINSKDSTVPVIDTATHLSGVKNIK